MSSLPTRDFSADLQNRLRAVEEVSGYLPCILIVNSIPDGSVYWMSQRGLRLLRTTNEELQALGPDYHERYFNPEDAADYVPKIMGLLQRADPEETVSHFQQVRYAAGEPYNWYLTLTRIFAFDESGVPSHTISTAFPIDSEHNLAAGAARLLEENNFLRTNIGRLHSLGGRERDVLRLVAAGQSNKEVAMTLGISIETVSTHRRNVKRKLGAANLPDLGRYAQALELL